MESSDVDEYPESEILVPSSETDEDLRPRKRRRLSRDSNSSRTEEGDYDLPPNDVDGKENKKSKYEDHIYTPAGDRHPDTFVTQLDQQFSSPSRIRGPRWMKPQQESAAAPVAAGTDTFASWLNRSARTPAPDAMEDDFDADAFTKSTFKPINVQPITSRHTQAQQDDFEVDEDDFDYLEALHESAALSGATLDPSGSNMQGFPRPRQALQQSTSFRQTTLHGINTTQQEPAGTQARSRAHNWPLANRDEPPTHHELDREAMGTWTYPTNLGRIRDYQYNITHKGLFHNLLVALPTGLGKTFIAATIMLNWYRWTVDAKIIFVAPAKPLVAQQIDACFNIAGIPRSDTTMLTGDVQPAIRAEEWLEKRVFFMTPQTLINDLKHGYCDPKKVVLLVVDEAHKATGSYAYVEVVTFLRRYNNSFRVLALTATPGKDVEKVQEVIDGLGIARVEIRTDESLDIRQFIHSRNVEIEVFENSPEMSMALELLASTIQPLLNKLNQQGAAYGRDPTRLTLFGLRESVSKWGKTEAGRNAHDGVKQMIRAISVPLMSLAHGVELLKYHGLVSFYHKLKSFMEDETGKGKYRKQILDDENFKKLMGRLQTWINDDDFIGHPKMAHLQQVILNHFLNRPQGSGDPDASSTRIMVFTHYRDSAEEIVRVLNRHKPMIRAHVFVGQSSSKNGSEGMNQKTQLDIIKKFKAGTYNTIVATSIGEEGLDIGEVDLILCYDCSKSPIRMLQRMGRTGRKRAGNIVLLVMKGKEEEDFRKSEDAYLKMQKKIESGKEFKFHEELSSRIVPKEITPVVDKRHVDIPVENTQAGSIEPTRRKARNAKKPAKKFHMPDGVETGFAFLGNSNKKIKVSKQSTSSKRKGEEDNIAPLPSIEATVLTDVELQKLDEQYIQLAGDDDEYTHQIRFDAYPKQWGKLSKTIMVKHSKTTRKVVNSYKAINVEGRGWDRPCHCPDIEDDLTLGSDEDSTFSRDKKPASKPQADCRNSRLSSNLYGTTSVATSRGRSATNAKSTARLEDPNEPSSGTFRSSSIGTYDENDSFINDGDALDIRAAVKKSKFTSRSSRSVEDDDLESLASLPSLSGVRSGNTTLVGQELPLVSQKSIDYDDMDGLPDLDLTLSTTRQSMGAAGAPKAKAGLPSPAPSLTLLEGDPVPKDKGRKRMRRVIDSDDEE
jgi:ATP-dependent DNA helicase MPH1